MLPYLRIFVGQKNIAYFLIFGGRFLKGWLLGFTTRNRIVVKTEMHNKVTIIMVHVLFISSSKHASTYLICGASLFTYLFGSEGLCLFITIRVKFLKVWFLGFTTRNRNANINCKAQQFYHYNGACSP